VSRPALAEKATFFSSIRHHVAAMYRTCEKAWHHLPVVLHCVVIIGVSCVWLRSALSHISGMSVRAFALLGCQCVAASFIGLAPSVPYILLRSAVAQVSGVSLRYLPFLVPGCVGSSFIGLAQCQPACVHARLCPVLFKSLGCIW
jgi:hypothetical protein